MILKVYLIINPLTILFGEILINYLTINHICWPKGQIIQTYYPCLKAGAINESVCKGFSPLFETLIEKE
jgi:hypothetical protein